MHQDITKYNEAQLPEEKALCDVLASEIDKTLLKAESKLWHGHPVWFLEGNPIVGYSKQKNHIQLLFWSGQSFEEETLLAVGKFQAAEKRYTTVEEVDLMELHTWLEKAQKIQWDYKNIVKRKGILERVVFDKRSQ